MARTNPIGTIKHAAIGTLRLPVTTAGKAAALAVGGAKGGVGLGRLVAGQVAARATDTVGSLLAGRKPAPRSAPTVPDTGARQAETSEKLHGDPVAPLEAPTKKAPAKRAPAKKSAVKATPDVSAQIEKDTPVNVTEELGLEPAPVVRPAKKAPAKKAPAKKAPAKRATAKKAPAKKAPAQGAVAPSMADAPVTSIDAGADASDVHVTPADIASAVDHKPAD